VISYALVMIVSLATGQPTQAFVEGPMSDRWCAQLIERYSYNSQDGTSVRVPTCLSWPDAQQVLVQNSCTRGDWTDRGGRRRLFDCYASAEVLPAAARAATAVSPAGAPVPDAMAVSPAATPEPVPDTTTTFGAAPPTEPPPLPEHKAFHLGPAAASLVTQAHAQMNKGGYDQASATLERALRIEPDNPLLWVELAQLRLSEGDATQADGIGRRALLLAEGDGQLQAMAWHVIAESLRARKRNPEAAEADRQADSLGSAQ